MRKTTQNLIYDTSRVHALSSLTVLNALTFLYKIFALSKLQQHQANRRPDHRLETLSGFIRLLPFGSALDSDWHMTTGI